MEKADVPTPLHSFTNSQNHNHNHNHMQHDTEKAAANNNSNNNIHQRPHFPPKLPTFSSLAPQQDTEPSTPSAAMFASTTMRPPLFQRQGDMNIFSHPFAGRIGGNQEFTVDKNNPEEAHLLEKTPDAAPFVSWRDSFNLHQFGQVDLWRAAVIEGWGACMLTFLTVVIAAGLGPVAGELSTGSLVPSIVAGVSNALILPLFIYSAGPVSGGHLNPTITIATFFARLSTLPRTILYVCFQCAGAAVAGGLIRAALGTNKFLAGGCYIDTSLVSVGSAFTFEFTTTMILIFLSFGVGLDLRQRAVFGPALAPALVGLILGVCTFGTGVARPGYTGVSANPARCLAVFVASEFPSYYWIHWVGPIAAGMVHGLFYWLIPPYLHRKAIPS